MPRRRTCRLILAAAIVGLLASLLAAPASFAKVVTPESGGSPNANDIDTLYRITLYVAIVIFLIVEGTLIWSLWRHRARRRGPEAVQIHGNTPLEMGWTIAAALILVVLTTITFIYLSRIINPPPSGPNGLRADATQFATVNQAGPPTKGGQTLTIDVNGQQYIWRFSYPGSQPLFTYYEMVVPTDTTVVLRVTGSDVIHSWWIPKLGGKVDGVPGYINQTWFKIHKPGLYRGVCAELCGFGHADMRAVVRAVPPDRFEAWARRQRADIAAAQQALIVQRKQRERTGGTE